MSHRHIFESGYFSDGMHVYYRGELIDSMTALSFEDLGCDYARDPFRVCFSGHVLSANPQSFEVLGHGYAKDAFHVYYQGEKMPGLMAATFVTLGNGYAKDSLNVYYYGRKDFLSHIIKKIHLHADRQDKDTTEKYINAYS